MAAETPWHDAEPVDAEVITQARGRELAPVTREAPVAGPLAALDAGAVEQLVIGGDLGRLAPDQRVAYYQAVCQSLGLNPLTQPFEYIRLNDKLRLYAKRDATDQLRRLHGISVEIVSREQQADLYVVTARATTPDGRTDEAVGAISLSGLAGANLANAVMKAETKAKRRVTLSICGLGWMDDSEVDSVPVARRVKVAESGAVEAEPSRRAPSASGRVSAASGPRTPVVPAAGDARTAAAREKLLRRWQELCAEAKALGIAVASLPRDAGHDEIIARGQALRRQVDARKRLE